MTPTDPFDARVIEQLARMRAEEAGVTLPPAPAAPPAPEPPAPARPPAQRPADTAGATLARMQTALGVRLAPAATDPGVGPTRTTTTDDPAVSTALAAMKNAAGIRLATDHQ